MKPNNIRLAIGILLLTAGCQRTESIPPTSDISSKPSSSPQTVALAEHLSTSGPTAPPIHEGLLPLYWQTVPDVRPFQVLINGLPDLDQIIKEAALPAILGAIDTKVIVYKQKKDTEFLHGALVWKKISYDLGPVAGYNYQGNDALQVQSMMIFQKQTIKISGAIGASAGYMTMYIDMENDIPQPLLHVESGYPYEQDVDHDGLNEIVNSVGTVPQTTLYRWAEDRAESIDLNHLLNAPSVNITKAGLVEATFQLGDISMIRLYRLTKEGLSGFEKQLVNP
ncbi:hypothetical protein [Paenibacillus sedimenti]|uniref:Lipoprotein n=1 Tax=Paenibacillus sedimenti TaxID=2770274 RepID=A0A926KNT5_9BACL|nr:hypothetical protein [Paenibacillus sedimenti]MBD0379415.1 hypothetical protein [Paenibacillus sedimenti]